MFRWVEADPDLLGIRSTHGQLVSMSDRAVIEHLRGLALEPVHGQPRQQQEAQIVEVGDRLGPDCGFYSRDVRRSTGPKRFGRFPVERTRRWSWVNKPAGRAGPAFPPA